MPKLHRDTFDQFPELIVVGDLNSRCIYSNNYTAKLFGYKNADSMLNVSPYDLRCPAVECADIFIKQNKIVINTSTTLTMLDIHKYATNESKILLTKKTPYIKSNKIQGCICYCIEVDFPKLKKLCSTLIQSDKKFYAKSRSNERSYVIGTPPENNKLSIKEVDYIFHFLRKDTAKVSPTLIKLMQKLGCKNKRDFIEYNVENGYLNYMPNYLLHI